MNAAICTRLDEVANLRRQSRAARDVPARSTLLTHHAAASGAILGCPVCSACPATSGAGQSVGVAVNGLLQGLQVDGADASCAVSAAARAAAVVCLRGGVGHVRMLMVNVVGVQALKPVTAQNKKVWIRDVVQ